MAFIRMFENKYLPDAPLTPFPIQRPNG